MKTIKYKIIVFLLIITNCSLYAQYIGGDADGSTLETISNTSCAIPPSFYTYFGGNSDAAAVDTLENTTCPFSNHFYAYFGGQADASAVETLETDICGFPPQFYTYFGGENDGSVVDSTMPICPTEPPVANFTASATAVCVGQTVTFTDSSTNIPSAWTWTFAGGTPSTSTDQNPVITYNAAGTYTVTLLAANFNGNDAVVKTAFITVSAIPTITTTTPAVRCDAGTVTLQATTNAGTLNWYANATGETSLATGTSFTTPSISTTTTYYVESVNGVCSSVRTAVIATVNTTSTITSTTPASRCGNGSVTLNATSSAGSTIWYANATGGTALTTGGNFITPSLSVTTTYYVEASNGTCVSPRTPVIATINTIPTITGTTPANRCDAGTLTLQATASSGATLNWYAAATGGTALVTGTSFTTPSISTTTTYYVEAVNGTCSSTRIAVLATVNPTPTITSTTPSSRCDAGTVTLSAAASAGNVVWYANATGGTALATTASFTTPSISTTTSYYVEAVNGSCASGTRTEVIATINPSPTITSTTPATICGGTFTISATASAGTLAWYNIPTGGIVQGTGNDFSLSNWAATTTFYVQATNGSCQSARIPVIVTVIGKPFNTALYPASRCGTGTVTLGAEYTIGTANWYTVASGGTAVASGPTFTTPSISSTTTYYVEGVNNGCVSEIRTAITATVNQQPTITSTTPASRCGNGTVTLQATASSGTISWYANATGGTALATGGSFTTPSLSITTTYFVEAANANCTTSRVAVIATINPGASISSTTPASRCGNGSVTLQATANSGTISWYASATGGTALATGGSFVTPSLTATTTYYVETDNDTCNSARTAVVATINTMPMLTGTTPASRCGNGSVTLQATASSGTISWYANATGGTALATGGSFVTPSLSATTTYYVETSNGSCTSVRTSVIATINATPTLTGTTPASRCGSGSVTLQATASSGTISWYANATGGTALATGGSFVTPSLSSTTTYYVEALNGSCTSVRTSVIATINATPMITETTPASRCGIGSVTLHATASSGTISWFASATGGTALATGGSFATPNLTATTTYYIEASSGSCTSSRSAVIASISQTASPTGIANQTFCQDETVGLIAVLGSNVIWYDAALGGNIVTSTTPISSGTTYYASQTVNGCESSNRLAVTMTLGNCLGIVDFVKLRISVYPNPTRDIVNVISNQMIEKVEVVNLLGQIIISKKSILNEVSVNLDNLPTATYLLRVTSDNNILKTFKILKE